MQTLNLLPESILPSVLRFLFLVVSFSFSVVGASSKKQASRNKKQETGARCLFSVSRFSLIGQTPKYKNYIKIPKHVYCISKITTNSAFCIQKNCCMFPKCFEYSGGNVETVKNTPRSKIEVSFLDVPIHMTKGRWPNISNT